MDEHFFLKGQRVITPDGEGEVVDSIGFTIAVKLDNGKIKNILRPICKTITARDDRIFYILK